MELMDQQAEGAWVRDAGEGCEGKVSWGRESEAMCLTCRLLLGLKSLTKSSETTASRPKFSTHGSLASLENL